MAGKADLVNSIVDSVDVITFEVLPFGLDPYGGGGLGVAPESTSGGLDPDGGAPTR